MVNTPGGPGTDGQEIPSEIYSTVVAMARAFRGLLELGFFDMAESCFDSLWKDKKVSRADLDRQLSVVAEELQGELNNIGISFPVSHRYENLHNAAVLVAVWRDKLRGVTIIREEEL